MTLLHERRLRSNDLLLDVMSPQMQLHKFPPACCECSCHLIFIYQPGFGFHSKFRRLSALAIDRGQKFTILVIDWSRRIAIVTRTRRHTIWGAIRPQSCRQIQSAINRVTSITLCGNVFKRYLPTLCVIMFEYGRTESRKRLITVDEHIMWCKHDYYVAKCISQHDASLGKAFTIHSTSRTITLCVMIGNVSV